MTDLNVTLDGDVEMPLMGFGTWQIRGRQAYEAVRDALDVGYRHIDTATLYGNEDEVGRALRDSGVPRDEVFVTTKLRPNDAGRERAVIRASLDALGTDHVDLWLIHWPPRGSVSTWQEFIAVRDDGRARAIGVSNYDAADIDELTEATGVTPAVNQIKWSPDLFDVQVADEMRTRGVVLEGYSPFRASRMDHPVLADIATAHGVTPAQIILRWHLDHGFVVIPKSVRRDRIAANFDVFGFSLDGDELARIDALGTRT
ncbi:MAG: aldo/keto reductase [Jiangellaceae bacterium]